MGSMHPAVRMANLLLLIVFVAHAHLPVLAIVALFAVVLSGKQLLQSVVIAAQYGWRLRWLFLSLLVIYLLFTPGTPILPNTFTWLPSQEGLLAGAQRMLAWFVMLFLFARYHLQSTRDEWQSGLYWLLKPFARLGLSAERLTVRMLLTFNAVSSMQQNYKAVTEIPAKKTWHNFIAVLTSILSYAHEQAEHAELNPVLVETLCPPDSAQWRSFFVLFSVLLGLVWLDYFLFSK